MPKPFALFFVFWIGLGIATTVFYFKASHETKKAFHPFIVSATGVIFLAFAESLTRGKLPGFFILMLVVILYLNIRNTQFCPQCNATLRGAFKRMAFCPKCGADLRG